MNSLNTAVTPSNSSGLSQRDQSPEDPSAEVARLKCTIAELHGNLNTGPNKRPTSTITMGRGIRRIVALFTEIPKLVRESDRREELLTQDDDEDQEDDNPSCDTTKLQRDRDQMYVAYQQLCLLVPNFKTNLLNTDPVVVSTYISSLTRGSNDARGDDINKVMKAVANWLNQLPATTPPINPEDRSMRGLKHDTTGWLLCPIEFNWDDEVVRANLREGAEGFNVSSSFFARCFYKNGTGDPQDVEKNFLRGYLLIKVYLAIFFSPSSANRITDDEHDGSGSPASSTSGSSKATKSTVAQRMHLESVTPRSIAYAAVLLHFLLTDAAHWKTTHNGFGYEHLYNFIIDFFEDVDGDRAKERADTLLQWWNKKVFPVREAAAANALASINKLKVQR
ncbi:hypothetical protein H0H81_003293, partial [Sphagnurus paluster]